MKVEDLAGLERELPYYDLALGLAVALNVYGFEVEHLALDDVDYDVDVAGLDVRAAQNPHYGVNIPVLSVVLAYLLYELVHLRGRKHVAFREVEIFHELHQLLVGKALYRIALERNLAYLVLVVGHDVYHDVHVARRVCVGKFKFYFGIVYLDVEIPVVAVEFAQLFDVRLKFVLLEPAVVGEVRYYRNPRVGLHLREQIH